MQETEGYCRICGKYTSMSFEHIPPRKAFNDNGLLFQTMQDLLSGRGYSKFRRGLGKKSLCESCNNLTGGWYGGAYVEWAKQGLVWLKKASYGGLMEIPFHIKPLNVFKQIVVMALAMSSETSIEYHEDLRRFVLNKDQRHLPPQYNFFSYFTAESKPRFASGMVVMNTNTGNLDYVDAELALPPFGYCVTSSKRKRQHSLAREQGLYEMGWFSNFDYNTWTTVYLRMPVQETLMPFPLDYRSQDAIDLDYRMNELNNGI